MFTREWSTVNDNDWERDLFYEPKVDQTPIHYSELATTPTL